MTVWSWILVGAGLLVALTALLGRVAPAGPSRPYWYQPRLAVAIVLLLTTIGGGGTLLSVSTKPPPEQLGIAVVITDVSSDGLRDFDLGLFLAQHVTVTGCGDRVGVELTLEPTAEFWADHSKELRKGGTVTFGIPDDDIDLRRVLRGQESSVPLPRVGGGVREQEELDPSLTIVDGVTRVTVEVPEWGRTLDPVTVEFDAAWTGSRTLLGGCHVELPALTGLPTVLTAARMSNDAWTDPAEPVEEVPDGATDLVVVSSNQPRRFAYYNPDHEVTRGVTTVDAGDYGIDEQLSGPPPNAVLQGTPGWTCRSQVSKRGIFTGGPGSEVSDYTVLNTFEGGAFSGARTDAITSQASCGSLLALESPNYGTVRDLLLIVMGALFSVAVEILITASRRRRTVSEE